MKLTLWHIHTFFFLILVSISAQAKDLSEAEIKALLSDKTVEGQQIKDDFQVIYYFAADGSLKSKDSFGTGTGKWSADGGEFCIEGKNGSFCGSISKSGDYYRTYCDHCSSDVHEFRKFTDGNIYNL